MVSVIEKPKGKMDKNIERKKDGESNTSGHDDTYSSSSDSYSFYESDLVSIIDANDESEPVCRKNYQVTS